MNINKFSIVASVYGVEKYLDDFFISLVTQTISFERHIELIVVDDGSTDGSTEIIKNWQEHYPNNIKYVYKENGGLSSARNEGLKHVTNNWVSFIDPDDFLNERYFEYIDLFLLNHQQDNIGLISCNYIYYLEGSDRLSDSHPLSFRFKQKETIKKVSDLEDFFQISVNSVFLRVDVIRSHSLLMDERVKPNFEDGHFLGRYLLATEEMNAVFLKEPKYYYRQREDSTSLIDTSWSKPEQYSDKLRYGSLNLLEYALDKKGVVPKYIQRMVLYDYIWYVKYIVDQKERFSFLSTHEQQEFITLSKRIFSYIESDVIVKFNLAGCWFFHKVAIIGFFKKEKLPFQIVYVEKYDLVKGLVLLRYFHSDDIPSTVFYLDGEEVVPLFSKIRQHGFFDHVFVWEHFSWIPIDHHHKNLVVNVGGIKTLLTFAGRQHHEGVPTQKIINHYKIKTLNDQNFPESIRLLRRLAKSPVTSKTYKNAWVFIDRDVQADDNAEHLYRYVVKHHPDVNAYFILRKDSHDWQRLEEEGFNLLHFNSSEHKLALLNADHVISSHIDHYVVSLLEAKWFSDLLSYRYTFLQHGITQNNVSNWLNSKSIDLFITATSQEFKSIAGNGNQYKFSSKEAYLTGFPRHDELLKLNEQIETEKLIVIMPTWRQGIVGEVVGQGNSRDINEDFFKSDYAQAWKSLLNSQELRQQVDLNGFKVVFFPHVNIQPYIEWFETPDYITIFSHGDVETIQALFSKASVMVTDYSSVAFEMAYINKAVIYYQFDYDDVFNEGHITKKGYFDYETDGFGPVCFNQDQVLNSLSLILNNNGLPEQNYLDRMKDTFAYRDGKCCQRVYEGIRNIRTPTIKSGVVAKP